MKQKQILALLQDMSLTEKIGQMVQMVGMLYDAKEAQEFARRMLEKGVYVVGFCYPVVPMGKARIRTQVSAGHTKEDLDFAVKCFKEVKEEMGI